MHWNFYGLTQCDIRRLVFQLTDKEKLNHPFDKNKKLAELVVDGWLMNSLSDMLYVTSFYLYIFKHVKSESRIVEEPLLNDLIVVFNLNA